MHAFWWNAIHFELLYSSFLPSNVQSFYILYLTMQVLRFDKIRTLGSLSTVVKSGKKQAHTDLSFFPLYMSVLLQ